MSVDGKTTVWLSEMQQCQVQQQPVVVAAGVLG
jgi:hypothetical protein